MKHWNFGQSRHISLLLDDFLDQKDAAAFKFFAGKEPWLVGIQKITCPVVAVFLAFQKQFVSGLSTGAVKG